MYYLQSRYYDPKICRFINADSYTSTGQGIIGHNMFAYCSNNPISRFDPLGQNWWEDFWHGVKEWLEEKKEESASNGNGTLTVGRMASAAFGIESSASLGITADRKGNIGLALALNGGGFPSAGIGGFVSANSAPPIFAQEGWGGSVGASGGPEIVAGGVEYNILKMGVPITEVPLVLLLVSTRLL